MAKNGQRTQHSHIWGSKGCKWAARGCKRQHGAAWAASGHQELKNPDNIPAAARRRKRKRLTKSNLALIPS
ncbi:hypothetical protein Acr_00g0049650 [Actinidia rufa]|uniref:Uncharacterized protein n=1 Tax=Actinidia rufa TaxID=165716 RepID=A0A7J0DM77_9ERIC|nr:hypothetical protein Acr_00g0049650 [Actinidia rufa]